MRPIEKAFHATRCELAEIGLLENGLYLDKIDLILSLIPSAVEGAMGLVWDEGVGFWRKLGGFEEGHIHIPFDVEKKFPRGLRDIIRHEFAHAWAWRDPKFFRRGWFREVFAARYTDGRRDEQLSVSTFRSQGYHSNYATPYAMTSAKEDFAETFMIFMKYRHDLGRFMHRKGFYRKLLAVRRAARVKSVTLRITFRLRTKSHSARGAIKK